MKHIIIAAFLLLTTTLRAQTVQDTNLLKQKGEAIRLVAGFLQGHIFTNRFKSIETPCVLINPLHDSIANSPIAPLSYNNNKSFRLINSNYLITLYTYKDDSNYYKNPSTHFKKNLSRHKSDSVNYYNGLKCLSENCARYMRFSIDNKQIDGNTDTLFGSIQSSYSYPISSLIQYIGFVSEGADKTNAYFNRLLSDKGTFKCYMDNNKYRIQVQFPGDSTPFNGLYTFSGYIEMSRDFKAPNILLCNIFFDGMSIEKGDQDNQIFLKFTSTGFDNEALYMANLVFNTLIKADTSNAAKTGYEKDKANGLWLRNFLERSGCSACNYIGHIAEQQYKIKPAVAFPNVDPLPPK